VRSRATLYAAVAAGSATGGVLRYLVSLLTGPWLGVGLPWATLFVNVTGSFVIGFYAARIAARDTDPRLRHFVTTGLCGGYTTFSAFSLETLRLAQMARLDLAALYIGLSVVAWLAAVWLGDALGRRG
jgi:CrcB protein